jgi:hypothetical protein
MPYRDPTFTTNGSTFEDGELRIPKDAKLPRVCLMCATDGGVRRRTETFAWRPFGFLLPFASATLLAGLASRIGRNTSLRIWQCGACAERWRRANETGPFVSIALGLGIIGALTVGLNGYPLGGIAVAVGATVGCVALRAALVHRARPRVVWIYESGVVALRGVSAAAAQAIVEAAAPKDPENP